MIAGGGVRYSGAGASSPRFSEAFGIPVAETSAGKGAFRDGRAARSAASGSPAPAPARVAGDADLVICVGTRLTDFATGSRSLFQHPDVRFVGSTSPRPTRTRSARSRARRDARVGARGTRRRLARRGCTAERLRAEVGAARDGVARDGSRAPSSRLAGGERADPGPVLGRQPAARAGDTVVAAAGSPPGDLLRCGTAAAGARATSSSASPAWATRSRQRSACASRRPRARSSRHRRRHLPDGHRPSSRPPSQEGLKITVVLSRTTATSGSATSRCARPGVAFGNEFARRGRLRGERAQHGCAAWDGRGAGELAARSSEARAGRTRPALIVVPGRAAAARCSAPGRGGISASPRSPASRRWRAARRRRTPPRPRGQRFLADRRAARPSCRRRRARASYDAFAGLLRRLHARLTTMRVWTATLERLACATGLPAAGCSTSAAAPARASCRSSRAATTSSRATCRPPWWRAPPRRPRGPPASACWTCASSRRWAPFDLVLCLDDVSTTSGSRGPRRRPSAASAATSPRTASSCSTSTRWRRTAASSPVSGRPGRRLVLVWTGRTATTLAPAVSPRPASRPSSGRRRVARDPTPRAAPPSQPVIRDALAAGGLACAGVYGMHSTAPLEAGATELGNSKTVYVARRLGPQAGNRRPRAPPDAFARRSGQLVGLASRRLRDAGEEVCDERTLVRPTAPVARRSPRPAARAPAGGLSICGVSRSRCCGGRWVRVRATCPRARAAAPASCPRPR